VRCSGSPRSLAWLRPLGSGGVLALVIWVVSAMILITLHCFQMAQRGGTDILVAWLRRL
jgi:hypothetical protein